MTGDKEIPDWQLERYLLGELPSELEAKVKKQLESDESARTRLAALEESNREILATYPSAVQARQIEQKYEEKYGRQEKRKREPLHPKLRTFAYALSTAALILIILIPLRIALKQSGPDREMEGIRPKGIKPHLVVYRKRGDEIKRLEREDKVAQGDIIQVTYVAAGKTYGVIYSIDGRGLVTLHFPDIGDETAPELDQNGEVSLPYAYELDDAPSFERFFFITSDDPFDIADVEEAVYALASKLKKTRKKSLNLPLGFKQYSVILNKGEY